MAPAPVEGRGGRGNGSILGVADTPMHNGKLAMGNPIFSKFTLIFTLVRMTSGDSF